jgi:tetratricopeptide (TPR) repeat protein
VATFGWREEEDARVTDPQVLRSQADEILELHERGELEAALRACDALLAADAATGVHDEVVRESVFAARFERGVLLTELGELDAAAEAYAEAAATPSDLDDPDQRHELAMALLNRGICLDALDRSEEALRVYDQLIAELGDADDPVTVDQVVRARVNRGAVLLTLERTQEALSVAEQLQSELDPQDALEAEQLVMAARLRASALVELDRRQEAATVLADVERCSQEEPGARAQIAAALDERAQLLADLGDQQEAIAVSERAQAVNERT